MNSPVGHRIVEIFEKHRATPGAPYDAAHFIDFLVANPHGKRDAYDSFRGRSRFIAFIEEVQYEFAVCFSMKDFEANYPLARFISRVEELQRSRRGSLKSLNNQVKADAGWGVLFVADFLLACAALGLMNRPYGLAAIVVIAVLVNGWFVRFAWRGRAYLAALRTRIETADG